MSSPQPGSPETTPTHPAQSVAPTPLWAMIPLLLLIITPIVALSVTIGNLRDDVVDDQMFAYFGWRVLNGATVYLDVWDNKPPGVYWANAIGLWIGSGSYVGVTVLCGLMLMMGLLSFFFIGFKLFHRDAAALATIVASFFLTHGWFQAGSNRTETFLIAFELLGLAIYVGAYTRPRWWLWFSSGMVFGIAFLFKQTGLAAWGAVGLHTMMLMVIGRLAFKQGVKQCLLLLGGVLTTIALASVYLASQGALAAAYHATFTFNSGYFAMGASRFPYHPGTFIMLREGAIKILAMPLLAGVAAILHATLCFIRPSMCDQAAITAQRQPPAKMPGIVFLATVWYLVAVLGALMSPHGFRHYVIPSLPPLMLLFTYLISQLQGEYGLMHAIQRRSWIAMTIVVLFSLGLVALNRQWESFSGVWVGRNPEPVNGSWVHWDMNPTWWETIGRRVAEISEPNDTIQSWGYAPGIYLYARRANICRYTTVEKIGQLLHGRHEDSPPLHPGAQAEINLIVENIKATYSTNPPDWFVLTSDDNRAILNPDQPAGIQGDLHRWVAEWMRANYTLREEVPTVDRTAFIYERRKPTTNDQSPSGQEG